MAEEIVIHQALNDYQIEVLRQRYVDVDAPDMKEFFFSQLYPPLEVAHQHGKRNADFHTLTQHWMVRLILHTGLIRGLRVVVDLHNLTEELDRRMVEKLLNFGEFSESLYNQSYREVTTLDERTRQLSLLLGSFGFVKSVVENPRFHLEAILNHLPRFLISNSDLLRLAKDGYRVFDSHRALLAQFHELIAEREKRYIETLFGARV